MGDFEQRVCAEIPHLRRYARSLARDPHLADDLVQDCLERALRKRHLWQPTGQLRAWLFRILYRIYLNQNGKRRSHPAVPLESYESRLSQPANQEDAAACWDIVHALEELPDDQRAAILLMALEAPSYKSAAKVLGIAIGTLRSRLSRGREALRRIDLARSEPAVPRLRRVK